MNARHIFVACCRAEGERPVSLAEYASSILSESSGPRDQNDGLVSPWGLCQALGPPSTLRPLLLEASS